MVLPFWSLERSEGSVVQRLRPSGAPAWTRPLPDHAPEVSGANHRAFGCCEETRSGMRGVGAGSNGANM